MRVWMSMLLIPMTACARGAVEDVPLAPAKAARAEAPALASSLEARLDEAVATHAGLALTADEAGRYLRAAAREGDTELVRGLVAAGADVEHADEKGYTPLILAAYHGHLDTVEALLAAGASACTPDRRGNTAMMGAAFKGYAPVVARLGEETCPVDQQNLQGRTALMFASLVGRTGIVRYLEGRGADHAKRDASGRTAGDWARTQGLDPATMR